MRDKIFFYITLAVFTFAISLPNIALAEDDSCYSVYCTYWFDNDELRPVSDLYVEVRIKIGDEWSDWEEAEETTTDGLYLAAFEGISIYYPFQVRYYDALLIWWPLIPDTNPTGTITSSTHHLDWLFELNQ